MAGRLKGGTWRAVESTRKRDGRRWVMEENKDRMQCRVQEHRSVGEDTVGHGGAQLMTAHWKECGRRDGMGKAWGRTGRDCRW